MSETSIARDAAPESGVLRSALPPTHRYLLFAPIAIGGSAAIHLGRQIGDAGFTRTLAIKRLRDERASDPELLACLLDEARIGARIRHANVLVPHDLVFDNGEVWLVMDYVAGDSLRAVLAALGRGVPVLPWFAASIVAGVLHGLHAAHEAVGDDGAPLGLVHRDVSPHNVFVGTDGVARIIDFGVAMARDRVQNTLSGYVKGKLGYLAPEQLLGEATDRRADVFGAGAVLWECLAGRRLADAGSDRACVLRGKVPAPSRIAGRPETALDAIVLRSLAPDPEDRFESAREMALAIERAGDVAPASAVGAWIARLLAPALLRREALVAQAECASMQTSWHARAIVNVARARASERPVPLDDETATGQVTLSRSISGPGVQWILVASIASAVAAGVAAALLS